MYQPPPPSLLQPADEPPQPLPLRLAEELDALPDGEALCTPLGRCDGIPLECDSPATRVAITSCESGGHPVAPQLVCGHHFSDLLNDIWERHARCCEHDSEWIVHSIDKL